jgi:hypothetical protein
MGKKLLPADFKEFIDSLNSNKVRYLLLGGWAVGLYGYPRATGDIDFLIDNHDDNLNKLLTALKEFGAPPVDISKFKIPGNVFRMGRSPVQIDIINQADGISFDDCYSRKKIINISGSSICVISKKDLIINKKSSGRSQDIADAEKLDSID